MAYQDVPIFPPYPLEIRSEPFLGVQYEVKDGHLIIQAGKNGKLCLRLANIPAFVGELLEIMDVWGGIRT